ncbi:MAG TPA: CoA transferase, partial [Dehalococcoidia bacterium]|nr:CoA transferase [Dehalococcoidia bacterium]
VMAQTSPVPDGPLAGVRITDFSWVWAGPFSTSLLGFLGAEVIRLESRTRFDTMRRIRGAPPGEQLDQSVTFSDINFNKRSVRLDLRRPEAKEIVRRLVRISDAVAENFSPGVLDRMGFSYEALRAIRPDIILISVSAAGQTGPDQHHVGYATIFNAVSGMGGLTGYADSSPVDIRDGSDLRVANAAAAALIASLIHRRRTGQGQRIDLSAREVLSALIGNDLLEYFLNGRVPTRRGNADPAYFPHECYPCAGDDRWVSVVVGTLEEWSALCGLIGRPEWAADPRFATVEGRRAAAAAIDAAIAAFTRARTPAEAADALQAAGVAAAPVLSNADVYADAHVAAREMIVEADHPVMGPRKIVGVPWRLSRTPARLTRSAPLLGEDTHYVLRDLLGLPEAEIADLEAAGVLL